MGTDELRQRLGFPAGASRWVRLLLYPALTPMFVLRHKVGVRMATVTRLLAAYCFLLFWGAFLAGGFALLVVFREHEFPSITDMIKDMFFDTPTTSSLPDWLPDILKPAPKEPAIAQPTLGGLWDAFTSIFVRLLDPLASFGLLTFVLGAVHRVVRWMKHLRGEQLNTKSVGISWLPLPFANDSVERYVDPLLFVAVGSLLFGSWPLVGAWILFCGIALAVVEKYVHEIQLDQYDALLSAQAHEQITSSYLIGLRDAPGPGRKGPRDRRPIPTGMSQDVRERMMRRLAGQGTPVSAIEPPPAARPALVAHQLGPIAAPPVAQSAPSVPPPVPSMPAHSPVVPVAKPAPAPTVAAPPAPLAEPPPRPSRPSSNSLFD